MSPRKIFVLCSLSALALALPQLLVPDTTDVSEICSTNSAGLIACTAVPIVKKLCSNGCSLHTDTSTKGKEAHSTEEVVPDLQSLGFSIGFEPGPVILDPFPSIPSALARTSNLAKTVETPVQESPKFSA